MRPVRLEFAGLQSYREKQELDFAGLLDGGLFGIFGPTGAGKSTILDAITLALYGKVGRAERGTTGIVNQAENRLYVKFTFGLGPETYRVERAYRREKDGPSVRSEHARLVRLDAGAEEVLADREREVTQRVVDLLGLQLDDFTRAVVLPQGQFAEFLHLSGSDRTQMLQRIFALEQYGTGLNQRLKQRLQAVRGQLVAVQAEQAGLGDASAEAVAAARQALEAAQAALAAAEQELKAAEAGYRTWERVWQLQQELRQVENRLAAWQGNAQAVEAWRQELHAARRAEGVRPHLEARDQAVARAGAAAAQLSSAEQALTAALAELAEAVRAHEAARSSRMAELPVLTGRQRDLQRAVALEAGLEAARGQVADLTARVAKGEALCAEVSSQLNEAEENRQALLARDTALREEIAAFEVPSEVRTRVSEALRCLDRLREARRLLAEGRRRAQQRSEEVAAARRAAQQGEALRAEAEQRLADLEREAARLEADRPADEADLRAAETWLGRVGEQIRTLAVLLREAEQRRAEYRTRADEAERAERELAEATRVEAGLRQAADAARDTRDAARAAVAEARRGAHAAALVSSLRPGAPCPVCGSLEHPHPVSPEAAAHLSAAEAELERQEAALREAELALERAAQQRLARAELASASAVRAAEARDALARAEAQAAEVRGQLPEVWRELGPDALSAALEREAAEQRERRARFDAWQAELARLQQQKQEQAALLARAAANASGLRARAEAAERAAAEAGAELHALEQGAMQRQAEFDAARGDMDPDAVESAQRRIDEADRRAEALRQSLKQLREEQEAQEKRLAELRRKLQDYTERLHQRKVELAQAQQSLSEVEGEWGRLSGGAPAAPQLARVEARLRQLEEDEAAAAAAREASERRRGQAESARAAAQREAELAAQRDAETAALIAAALEAAGFADGAEARAALRSPDRQSELEARIRAHEQEGAGLENLRSELIRQLDGRSLTEDEWHGWGARLEQARTAAEVNREARARAEQVLDDILSRQRRWEELEQRRSALAEQVANLEELQKVLRGNAFVDFLAKEQMKRVAADASRQLGQLTRQRYALELDRDGGFLVRDDANGGARRAVASLSGGETFLASLSLALALSAQIQLRGRYPLEFFFLDEGFGTLDPELLDTVVTALERLHYDNFHVGVISHVAELRARLQRRVIVEPAEPGGRGSRLRLERA
ncbi:exonuclease SbcC [Symbiobacterium terraclitae]|uniref:Nuclease SbcCD subunit C n=1 Tax=Symbiobacterium terraclitae TaxID=557451 RepID=A0ABS4JWP9_9FIRM|nr:AAA family ATPase [Symbiobacterium terraclitae]MBP2019955.1 exonuclease SbcC [Symbiobacterium terraclitae]